MGYHDAVSEDLILKALDDYMTRDAVTNKRISLENACLMNGFALSVVFRQMQTSDKIRSAYALAREARANALADRLEDIGDDVLDGKLDANAARVASANFQWIAARGDKSRFSEHSTSESRQVHELDFTGLSDAALEEVTLLLEGKVSKGL